MECFNGFVYGGQSSRALWWEILLYMLKENLFHKSSSSTDVSCELLETLNVIQVNVNQVFSLIVFLAG